MIQSIFQAFDFFKVIIIGFLILILMIPSVMIHELVRERSFRKMEVTNERH